MAGGRESPVFWKANPSQGKSADVYFPPQRDPQSDL